MLITGLTILLFFLIFSLFGIVLLQQGKSDLAAGGSSKTSQMLFGGSGGQDVFSKITWVLGFLLIATSLILAKLKSYEPDQSMLSGEKIEFEVEKENSDIEENTNNS